ncbi:hypothetical protein OE88DRAFT_1665628 [Heliocybe sulcata]|uniref:Uncharacterized protein n=1 Tax=Heliocybe sulcata TaxID=5364 RepID=A0A5C3MSS4_9AGAM|nr:hypothetical protein OE88DRAFT_1665628 [Heliocybe sulcata]
MRELTALSSHAYERGRTAQLQEERAVSGKPQSQSEVSPEVPYAPLKCQRRRRDPNPPSVSAVSWEAQPVPRTVAADIPSTSSTVAAMFSKLRPRRNARRAGHKGRR